jgi:hypothetical protein
MIVYKALDAQYLSTFQFFKWPLPKNGKPGTWLKLDGEPELCYRGFHGWKSKHRAFQEGFHVYEMEITGKIKEDHEKVCGTRARLVCEIFTQPVIPWEQFVASTDSAFEIMKKAQEIRKDVSDNGGQRNEDGLRYGYQPCVPSFHVGPLKVWEDHPDQCGICGLNSNLHDGWEERVKIAEKLKHFDMWELILYIQQILNGKEP